MNHHGDYSGNGRLGLRVQPVRLQTDRWRRSGRSLLWSHGHQHIITIEPGKRSGKACIRGLRIIVSDVLDYLAGGMTEDDLLRTSLT